MSGYVAAVSDVSDHTEILSIVGIGPSGILILAVI